MSDEMKMRAITQTQVTLSTPSTYVIASSRRWYMLPLITYRPPPQPSGRGLHALPDDGARSLTRPPAALSLARGRSALHGVDEPLVVSRAQHVARRAVAQRDLAQRDLDREDLRLGMGDRRGIFATASSRR